MINMKWIKLRIKLTALLLFATIEVLAYGTEINGIHYNLSKSQGTAQVTYTGSSYSNNTYSGNIRIPSSVTHEGVTYIVISIGYNAFWGVHWADFRQHSCFRNTHLRFGLLKMHRADIRQHSCFCNIHRQRCLLGVLWAEQNNSGCQ